MMPSSGREARSLQLSELSRTVHEMYTGEEFSRVIESAKNEVERAHNSDPDSHRKKRELEVLEEKRNKSSKLPTEFVEKLTRKTNIAQGAWEEAKKSSNYSLFSDHLEGLVNMAREQAEYYGYSNEKYDALVDDYEKGITGGFLEDLFFDLRKKLIPIVDRSRSFPNPFPRIPSERQELFCKKLPAILGLSESESRLDRSAHPFSTSLGPKDKRITTRYDETDPLSSVFGVMHEVGHSLYETGLSLIPEAPHPIAEFLSLGVHESQSRLWENQVGRSEEFWTYYYPIALEAWGLNEAKLPFEKLMQSIHSIEKTKIRVEADQVTYNLHIILRFEIERDLINGKIQVADLPEIWNAKMMEYFRLKIDSPAEGVLQDVHWCMAAFGYFPTYALGNIFSAQLYHTFLKENPNFPEALGKTGDTGALLDWLREKVHLQGSYHSVDDLILRATGKKPSSDDLIQYLIKIGAQYE